MVSQFNTNLKQNHSTSFDVILRHSTSFDVIRRHSTSFDVIRRHSTSFDVIRRHSTSFDAIRRHSTPFDVIRRHSTSFDAIRRHSTPFDIIIHHRSSSIFCLPANTLRNIKKPVWHGLGEYKASMVWHIWYDFGFGPPSHIFGSVPPPPPPFGLSSLSCILDLKNSEKKTRFFKVFVFWIRFRKEEITDLHEGFIKADQRSYKLCFKLFDLL